MAAILALLTVSSRVSPEYALSIFLDISAVSDKVSVLGIFMVIAPSEVDRCQPSPTSYLLPFVMAASLWLKFIANKIKDSIIRSVMKAPWIIV